MTIKETCKKEIHSVPKEAYGDLYREHLLEQYKTYIKSVNHTSDLRHRLNSYFLTVNTLLLTAIGASLYKEAIFIRGGGGVAIPFVGIIISIIWWAITFSYKQRNLVKISIVHCIEDQLPLALYKTEWNILMDKKGQARYHFFKISLLIPWVFVLLYGLIIFFSF